MRHDLPDLAATDRLAAFIAGQLKPRDVVLLYGDVGAGKTTLTRALLRALDPSIDEVPSPTFTLLQTYETPRGPVFHFDLYRLKHPDEIDELGFDDALAEGIVMVEWPEQLGARVPKNARKVRLDFDGASGLRWAELEGFDDE